VAEVNLEQRWGGRGQRHPTPISTQLTPPEAAYILSDCDANALVVSRELITVATDALDILKHEDAALPARILKLSTGTGVSGGYPCHTSCDPCQDTQAIHRYRFACQLVINTHYM
jgi:hypothetical protein